ncbi:hypothetical protein [Hymenobacter siberiensis]|uniref:hypothetical protein n=1 Tax=Hymenobacter siberiensis TaxID=2848396 RepID=UPI001C1E24BB|nr:hypothetical protein [Hymenobacter siberiensis]
MNENEKVSYLQAKGITPYDWNAFLTAEHRTEEQWNIAKTLSRDWVSCACGSQCNVLPRRHYNGEPKDEMLSELGLNFMDSIDDGDIIAARQTLADIEERTAFLLTCPNYTDPLDGSNDQ